MVLHKVKFFLGLICNYIFPLSILFFSSLVSLSHLGHRRFSFSVIVVLRFSVDNNVSNCDRADRHKQETIPEIVNKVSYHHKNN